MSPHHDQNAAYLLCNPSMHYVQLFHPNWCTIVSPKLVASVGAVRMQKKWLMGEVWDIWWYWSILQGWDHSSLWTLHCVQPTIVVRWYTGNKVLWHCAACFCMHYEETFWWIDWRVAWFVDWGLSCVFLSSYGLGGSDTHVITSSVVAVALRGEMLGNKVFCSLLKDGCKEFMFMIYVLSWSCEVTRWVIALPHSDYVVLAGGK